MPSITRNLHGADRSRRTAGTWMPTQSESLLYDLLGSSLVLAEDWERLSPADRERLLMQSDRDRALNEMVEYGLLTAYQSARIATGNTFGLVLGNFRILERIGAGGMAIVYKAEHMEMRHLVAIKVLQLSRDDDPRLEARFSAEMRAVARLRHPNIVSAMDAGRAYSNDPDGPVLWYMVMEFVPGENLDECVRVRGPLPVAQACNLIHQIASALAETHRFNLVHRDIKPSNILVTPEEQAKLLDFGLSRNLSTRRTQAGTVLGTIDFMAPEQARDASTVDIRADLYSLGGTLFWCLTGQLPFSTNGTEIEVLIRRLTQQPPSLSSVMPDLPSNLEAVVKRMMALEPEDRYATPQEVMQALLPFLRPDSSHSLLTRRPSSHGIFAPRASSLAAGARVHRVLIVDDEASIRRLCREVLKSRGVVCEEASNGGEALERVVVEPPDLMLVDVNMPSMSGPELLQRIRANPPAPNLKVIMFSGQASGDEMAEMMLAGADDYLTKPFSIPQLIGRVQTALRLKEAQDRSDRLNQQMLAVNAELELSLNDRNSDLAEVRTALVLGLVRLMQLRENDSGQHLERMQHFCRTLAEEASSMPNFVGQIDHAFVDMLACCAPLHDIGKVGLPDHILLKPGKLAPEERILMQAHTTMPADTLTELAQEFGSARAFLQMASDISRHHHERYDGSGYPDRLAGNAIPLAARIVAIADVYDALRSRRSYKPALSHLATVQLMTGSAGQFDPALLQAFHRCADRFDKIFQEFTG
jgi:response regulator RpfG family c-di-GMP phosphodiesterase/tRNA A-37 threonylcarbamoyl transferase component Bud32